MSRVVGFAAVLAAVLSVLDPSPGQTAVRHCLASVRSEAVGKTETEARRKALEGWRDLVTAKDARSAAWHVAADKRLQCTRADGLFVCRAEARPCVISQTPNPPPKRLDI